MRERRPGFRVPEQLLLPWSPRATVSTQHAAKLLDVSIRTIMRMCESGELAAYKVRKGKTSSPWRINYDSLVAHIERIHKEHGLETRF
jgi:excisionase family DNA binding protein